MSTMFQITIPVDDIPPPFKERGTNEDYQLLVEARPAREGTMLPVSDRHAVLELLQSEEKHKLRRQQQLLTDIAQRCREQEISDLTNHIIRKCNLSEFDKKYQRSYHNLEYDTTSMWNKTHAFLTEHYMQSDDTEDIKHPHVTHITFPIPPLKPEKGNSHFPPRRTFKMKKREYGTQIKGLPQVQIGYVKGLTPSDRFTRLQLLAGRNINGTVQLQHIRETQWGTDQLAPLVLPSIKCVGIADKDKVDSYLVTNKVGSAGDEPKCLPAPPADPRSIAPSHGTVLEAHVPGGGAKENAAITSPPPQNSMS